MRVTASERTRHFIVRAHQGELLPDSLLEALRVHEVRAGWATGHGVLADVELRGIEGAEPGAIRKIEGPVRAVVIDAAIGACRGDTSVGLRAVLCWEGATGLETVAGELVAARVVGLEAHVVSLEDASIERGIDRASGVWLWAVDVAASERATREAPARDAAPRAKSAPEGWGDAIAASEQRDAARITGGRTSGGGAALISPRRPAPVGADPDEIFPAAGDIVEHFAFGRCEILKSDGDRIHLKIHKDGRVREIALEMLRVTPLESAEPGRRRFKLDKKG